MALSAKTVWEIQTGGSDSNGGGYVSDAGTTDYSQQTAAQLTVADGATSGIGVTTLTSVTGGFTDQMVGSIVHIYSGTNLTDGWFEITGHTDTNEVTLDRAPDDGVGGVSAADVKVGGALATPGGLGKVVNDHGVADMKAWIKKATYNLSNTTVNVSGGALDLAAAVLNKAFLLRGYDSSRGDFGRPTINCDTITPTNGAIIKCDGAYNDVHVIENFILDGNSKTVAGIVGDDSRLVLAHNVTVQDCDGSYGFYRVGASYCKSVSCGGGAHGFSVCRTIDCWADNNAGNGFDSSSVTVCNNCISSNNAIGYLINYTPIINCISYKNSSDGYKRAYALQSLNDCISVLDGGYAFNMNEHVNLISCASYNTASGRTPAGTPPRVDIHPITLTANPFVDGDNGDFRLHTTNGAALQEEGLGVIGQTDTPDVNAISAIRGAGGGGLIRRLAKVHGGS